MFKILRNRKSLIGSAQDLQDADAVTVSLEGMFRDKFKSTTEDRIEEICTAERSSTRSVKQRAPKKKRPLVRSESWTGRLEPEALAALEIAAEHFGERTISDGMHALAFEFIKRNKITKRAIKDRIEQQAEKREKYKSKRKKNGQRTAE